MSERLYLVRIVLDRRALARVGATHGRDALDESYLLHAGLAKLFATSSEPAEVPLHVFAYDDIYAAQRNTPDLVYVLGYADEDEDALQRRMGPSQTELLRVCKVRPMPDLVAGQRVDFRTRVCPVVRTRKPGENPLRIDRAGKVKPREIDAFLHATLGVSREVKIEREDVYRDWLRAQVMTHGGGELVDARLAEFRRDVMRRKGGASIERPNAVLEGTLAVTDPVAFAALLRRGVGRHRAFGFGMLLLRPPRGG